MSACSRFNHRLWLVLASLLLLAAGGRLYADNEASEARLKKDVTYLASDECEGRGVTTKGIDKAADYIAKEFEKAGLKPGGVKGTWFQPFTIAARAAEATYAGAFKLKGPQGQVIELGSQRDFVILGASGGGKVDAGLVFVGYGATAPKIDYDDYKDLDVAGKVVVLIRRVPRWASKDMPFDAERKEEHAAIVKKLKNAQEHKAAAVLLVNDVSEVAGGDPFLTTAQLPPASSTTTLPALQVKRAVLDPILQNGLKVGLKEIEQDIDRDLKPRSGVLTGWTAQLELNVRKEIACKNVVGVLEGKGPLANETVVIGAHYDHLGFGDPGSLGKGSKAIHHGADDNASGSTAVLELARRFGAIKDRQGRRLVFMTFSAEERGLLGSFHYCKQPLFPLADTVAMLNLDMVGRLPTEGANKDKLLVEGVGTAKELDGLLEEFNKKHKFNFKKSQGAIPASDHYPFMQKKIPILFLWNSTHPDYHKPSDTSDRINIQGMRRIVDLSENLIEHFSKEKRMEFGQAKIEKRPPLQGNAPRLGVQPDYSDEKEGVLLERVTAKGPADKAGLKAGDRILEVAGKSVKGAMALTAVMAQQKAGQTIEVMVLRDGKKLTLKVTPE